MLYRHRFAQRAARTVLFALSATAFSCAHAQDVHAQLGHRFAGSFFPSFAIGAAGLDANVPVARGESYGHFASSQFSIRVLGVPSGSTIRAEVEIPGLGVAGSISTTSSSGPVHLMPHLSWRDQGRLMRQLQPETMAVVYRVFVDERLTVDHQQPVRVRAITDAPLRSCDRNAKNKCEDVSAIFAAYVNEDHPAIDAILREVLSIPALPVKAWRGTMVSADDAIQQVWAIWYWLQRNGTTYSNIATVAGGDTSVLMSQTVRPLSMTLATQQANCIDGTVFLASVLRKIGIEPFIVLVPGHAYLGFYTDPGQQQMALLETTMLNTELNPFRNRQPTKAGVALARGIGTDVHAQRSWQSFQAALRAGTEQFERAKPYIDARATGFSIVSIARVRAAGMMPIGL